MENGRKVPVAFVLLRRFPLCQFRRITRISIHGGRPARREIFFGKNTGAVVGSVQIFWDCLYGVGTCRR